MARKPTCRPEKNPIRGGVFTKGRSKRDRITAGPHCYKYCRDPQQRPYGLAGGNRVQPTQSDRNANVHWETCWRRCPTGPGFRGSIPDIPRAIRRPAYRRQHDPQAVAAESAQSIPCRTDPSASRRAEEQMRSVSLGLTAGTDHYTIRAHPVGRNSFETALETHVRRLQGIPGPRNVAHR